MLDKIRSLDPFLVIGLSISIALAIVLVLMGQDEVQSLLVGLVATAITLSVDVIARLKETEERILKGTALGVVLLEDPGLHDALHQIARSYRSAQQTGFDLFLERNQGALLDCKDILGALERGYMMADVAGRYSYGQRGTSSAQRVVKAVSYGDIELWRTAHLQGVLRMNAEATKRGVDIVRVFILEDESIDQCADVLAEHHGAGVRVYTVSPASLPTVHLLESYMIVDDKVLVTFYFTRDGKSFREERVSIDPVDVGRAVGRFESIYRRAIPYLPDWDAA